MKPSMFEDMGREADRIKKTQEKCKCKKSFKDSEGDCFFCHPKWTEEDRIKTIIQKFQGIEFANNKDEREKVYRKWEVELALQEAIQEAPMGVSQWMNHGEKYHYLPFMLKGERQRIIAQIREEERKRVLDEIEKRIFLSQLQTPPEQENPFTAGRKQGLHEAISILINPKIS